MNQLFFIKIFLVMFLTSCQDKPMSGEENIEPSRGKLLDRYCNDIRIWWNELCFRDIPLWEGEGIRIEFLLGGSEMGFLLSLRKQDFSSVCRVSYELKISNAALNRAFTPTEMGTIEKRARYITLENEEDFSSVLKMDSVFQWSHFLKEVQEVCPLEEEKKLYRSESFTKGFCNLGIEVRMENKYIQQHLFSNSKNEKEKILAKIIIKFLNRIGEERLPNFKKLFSLDWLGHD
jgi:hypothetical protein